MTDTKDPWGIRADKIGHWHEGPETFVIVKAKDLKPGTQTYGPPVEQQVPADEREAFEAEMRCEEVWGHRSLKKRRNGEYENWQVRLMWDVWQARATLQPGDGQGVCRTDGRCQYAIDHGAEDLGHCPKGKCVMPTTPALVPYDPICQAIDKADDIEMEGDYMLDSDDCMRVVRTMQALIETLGVNQLNEKAP